VTRAGGSSSCIRRQKQQQQAWRINRRDRPVIAVSLASSIMWNYDREENDDDKLNTIIAYESFQLSFGKASAGTSVEEAVVSFSFGLGCCNCLVWRVIRMKDKSTAVEGQSLWLRQPLVVK